MMIIMVIFLLYRLDKLTDSYDESVQSDLQNSSYHDDNILIFLWSLNIENNFHDLSDFLSENTAIEGFSMPF